jgi:hypothetical protein
MRRSKFRALVVIISAWAFLLLACGRRPQPNQSESQQPQQTPSTNAASTQPQQPATSTADETTRRELVGSNQTVTVPAGTVISIRVNELLGSDVSHTGETFDGTVASPVAVNRSVAIPTGAAASGTVVAADSAGHFRGRSELELRLTGLRYNGQTYDVHSKAWVRLGTARGRRSVEVIGGGAGLGAVIGAIVGGGKGAAIGAATGAGAGTATQELTKPGQVRVPPETVLPFQLTEPIDVKASTARLR